MSGSARRRGGVCALTASIVLAAQPAMALDAFPGAQGHGRGAQGGRGGKIIYVTTLADSGAGSLRACVEQTGPRSCVFRVGGTITLQKPLQISHPTRGQLSIFGQTAPGGGIQLTLSTKSTWYLFTPLVIKNTSDVIVQHVRLRSQFRNTVGNVDAVTIEDASRIYLDHVSASWATDENLNIHSQGTDITIANSLFGEGLMGHSKCALLGSDPEAAQKITFWRNLCLSHRDRNPDVNHYSGSCIDIIDNVFYNPLWEFAEVFSQQKGGTPVSFVGNYFKAGPSTAGSTKAIYHNSTGSVAAPRIFQQANAAWGPAGKTVTLIAPSTTQYIVSQPSCPLSATSFKDPVKTYAEIRAKVGAFPRDSVDTRFVSQLGALGAAGTGALVSVAGSLPTIANGQPYIDADLDGIADSAEARFGAVKGRADAWTDSDKNGWANFDDFMQWLSAERLAGRYPN